MSTAMTTQTGERYHRQIYRAIQDLCRTCQGHRQQTAYQILYGRNQCRNFAENLWPEPSPNYDWRLVQLSNEIQLSAQEIPGDIRMKERTHGIPDTDKEDKHTEICQKLLE